VVFQNLKLFQLDLTPRYGLTNYSRFNQPLPNQYFILLLIPILYKSSTKENIWLRKEIGGYEDEKCHLICFLNLQGLLANCWGGGGWQD
jgi:hypothetical protein